MVLRISIRRIHWNHYFFSRLDPLAKPTPLPCSPLSRMLTVTLEVADFPRLLGAENLVIDCPLHVAHTLNNHRHGYTRSITATTFVMAHFTSRIPAPQAKFCLAYAECEQGQVFTPNHQVLTHHTLNCDDNHRARYTRCINHRSHHE